MWLCAALLLCLAAAQDIDRAFAQDGFAVVARSSANGTAVLANSTTAFNLRTGNPKRAFYARGSPYSWGRNVALLAYDDLVAAAGAFLQKIPLALIAPAWVEKHSGWAVKELEKIIDDILTTSTSKAFDVAVADGSIPSSVVDEMQGLVDGAQQMDKNTIVTIDKLKAINYGFDVITARVFSGHLVADILAVASPALTRKLRSDRRFLRELAACDGIGVRGDWTASNYSTFLMRDLQFEMADVLQDHIAIGVFVPEPPAAPAASSNGVGENLGAAVRIFAPGFVGAFAGLSERFVLF